MAIVKNELVVINNVLTIVFTTFYCYLLCFNHHKGITDVLPTVGWYSYRMVQVVSLKQICITPGKSRVAAVTAELILQFLECFPIQDSVYSLPMRTKH